MLCPVTVLVKGVTLWPQDAIAGTDGHRFCRLPDPSDSVLIRHETQMRTSLAGTDERGFRIPPDGGVEVGEHVGSCFPATLVGYFPGVTTTWLWLLFDLGDGRSGTNVRWFQAPLDPQGAAMQTEENLFREDLAASNKRGFCIPPDG